MRNGISWEIVCNGLWSNSKDAVRHALEHLRELASTKDDKAHHIKWAILSVHQAAECFCNILLIKSNPMDPSLIRNGKPWYPSLRYTAERLLADPLNSSLSPGEIRLLQLIKELPNVRDRLMHRTLPDDLDSSIAAISMLGLLRVARRRIGEPAPEFEHDSPRIEAEVYSVIPYKRVEHYCRFAEQLLHEEYPNQSFAYCGSCGTQSIIARHCEICFEEMESFKCPHCGEEEYMASWERYVNPAIELECTSCGKKFTA